MPKTSVTSLFLLVCLSLVRSGVLNISDLTKCCDILRHDLNFECSSTAWDVRVCVRQRLLVLRNLIVIPPSLYLTFFPRSISHSFHALSHSLLSQNLFLSPFFSPLLLYFQQDQQSEVFSIHERGCFVTEDPLGNNKHMYDWQYPPLAGRETRTQMPTRHETRKWTKSKLPHFWLPWLP